MLKLNGCPFGLKMKKKFKKCDNCNKLSHSIKKKLDSKLIYNKKF